MKTFVYNLIDRFSQYSQTLDVEAVLCQKCWYVINEELERECLIFQRDGKVIVSVNGDTKRYTWQYLSVSNSIIIDYDDLSGIMLKPAYFNQDILALRKDGTKECMFLIDDRVVEQDKVLALNDIEKRLLEDERREKQLVLQAKEEEDKRIETERQRIENEIELAKDLINRVSNLDKEKIYNYFDIMHNSIIKDGKLIVRIVVVGVLLAIVITILSSIFGNTEIGAIIGGAIVFVIFTFIVPFSIIHPYYERKAYNKEIEDEIIQFQEDFRIRRYLYRTYFRCENGGEKWIERITEILNKRVKELQTELSNLS